MCPQCYKCGRFGGEATLSKGNLGQHESDSEQDVEEDSIKQLIHSNESVGKSILK